MQHVASYHHASRRAAGFEESRLRWLQWFFVALGALVAARLFYVQIWNGQTYRLWAANQHELQAKLIPQRGRILARDRVDGTLHPLATNKDVWTLYAVPKSMKNPGDAARELAPLSGKTEAELVEAWTARPDDPYEPVAKNLSKEQADAIREKKLEGIGLLKTWARSYPEANIGGHMIDSCGRATTASDKEPTASKERSTKSWPGNPASCPPRKTRAVAGWSSTTESCATR